MFLKLSCKDGKIILFAIPTLLHWTTVVGGLVAEAEILYITLIIPIYKFSKHQIH